MEEAKEWYRVLEVIRGLCPNWESPVPFSAEDVMKAAGISKSEKCTAKQNASGIISTLYKWGYVKRHGSLPSTGPGKPSATYVITEYGAKVEQRESKNSQLESLDGELRKLIQAVRNFQSAEGEKAEAKALKELFRVCDEVDISEPA